MELITGARLAALKKSLPALSSVHVDRPLTNVSVAFLQSRANFVANRVFPFVPVGKKTDKYFTFDRAYWLGSRAQRRAAGAKPVEGGYTLSTDSYDCEREGIGIRIPDPVRANADAGLNLDRQGVEWVTQQLMLAMEVDFATKYFTTSIWDNAFTGAAGNWDDVNSTPIEDVDSAKRTILQNTAFEPNVLVLGVQTFDKLKQHPDIIARISGAAGPGNPAIANEALLARLFGLEEVIVSKAVRNTAAEGATASYAFINGSNDAMLVYRPPSPGLMVPAAGYHFVWNADGLADGGTGLQIQRYRIDEREESDLIVGHQWWANKVVSSALGGFFSNIGGS